MEFGERLFSVTGVPPKGHSINYGSNMRALTEVKRAVGSEVWEHVHNSPLGNIPKFMELEFQWSSKLVHYCIANLLVCDKPNEVWSLLGVKPARFSLVEFENITKLNCGDFPDNKPVIAEDDFHRFWKLLKLNAKGIYRGPSSEDIRSLCKDCISWSKKDKIRLCYLAILTSVLIAPKRTTAIPLEAAKMVMDLEYFELYPWGRVSFQELIQSVKDVTEKRLHNSYVLRGFVQPMQIWAYVTVPAVGDMLGNPLPVPASKPSLLRFRGMAGKLRVTETFLNGRVFEEANLVRSNSLICCAKNQVERKMLKRLRENEEKDDDDDDGGDDDDDDDDGDDDDDDDDDDADDDEQTPEIKWMDDSPKKTSPQPIAKNDYDFILPEPITYVESEKDVDTHNASAGKRKSVGEKLVQNKKKREEEELIWKKTTQHPSASTIDENKDNGGEKENLFPNHSANGETAFENLKGYFDNRMNQFEASISRQIRTFLAEVVAFERLKVSLDDRMNQFEASIWREIHTMAEVLAQLPAKGNVLQGEVDGKAEADKFAKACAKVFTRIFNKKQNIPPVNLFPLTVELVPFTD